MKASLKRRLTGLCYGYLRGQPDWAHEKSPEVRHARVLPMANQDVTGSTAVGGHTHAQ